MEMHHVRGRLNPKFHFPYILRERFKKTGKKWLIIDERSGLVLFTEAEEKDREISQ